MNVRVAVIGAGSSHAPRVVAALAREAPADARLEVLCVDPEPERLNINVAYAAALLDRAGLAAVTLRAKPAFTAEDADADAVISMFRVGGLTVRLEDEARAQRHGLLAQETHGWAGFASALRNVPVATEVSTLLRVQGSDAWHIVVSNPVGILTAACAQMRPTRTLGVCDMPSKLVGAVARALAVPHGELDVGYVGLNHCGWITHATTSEGQNVLPRLLREPVLSAVLREAGGPNIPPVGDLGRICADLGALPSPYLRYFYARQEMIERSRSAALRADECLAIDRETADAYRALDVERGEATMRQRGGSGIADVVAAAVWEQLRPAGRRIVGCTLLSPSLPCVDSRAAVELLGGPPQAGALHPQIQALLSQVAAYEVMTADAARSGDVGAAVLAAAANPWIGTADLAERLLHETLDEQQHLLPSFG